MDLAVAILRDLLRYAAQLPTLFRDISMNHLPGLLTSLLGLRPEVRPPPSASVLWPLLVPALLRPLGLRNVMESDGERDQRSEKEEGLRKIMEEGPCGAGW